MRRIHVTDTAELPYVPAIVWKTLVDFPASPVWWGPNVVVTVQHFEPAIVGTIVSVRPYGGLGFRCRVSEVNSETEMKMEYFEGIYRGIGIWRLTPNDKGTRLSYEIDLEIKSVFMKVLSCFLNIGSIHSRLMQQVFENLKQHIGRSCAAT